MQATEVEGEWCPRLSSVAVPSSLAEGRWREFGEMEGASVSTNPRSVDEVFKDYRGRRAGMLKALTSGKAPTRRSCVFAKVTVAVA